MTAADRLEHERETLSLGAGWLLILQQTQGFVAARHPIPGADMKFSMRNADRQPSQKAIRKTPWNPLQQAFAETPRAKAWPESFAEALD